LQELVQQIACLFQSLLTLVSKWLLRSASDSRCPTIWSTCTSL
jgi:hypothetical protein